MNISRFDESFRTLTAVGSAVGTVVLALSLAAACNGVGGSYGSGAGYSTGVSEVVSGTSGTYTSASGTQVGSQSGATQANGTTGIGVTGSGETVVGQTVASSGGDTSAQDGVTSVNGSGANDGAAVGNGAAEGGAPEFVSDLDGCNGLTVDASVRADEAGNFDPPELDIPAGAVVRFAPIGGTGMRSLSGDFETAPGDTTCVAFNRRGTYVFDGLNVPTRLTVRAH